LKGRVALLRVSELQLADVSKRARPSDTWLDATRDMMNSAHWTLDDLYYSSLFNSAATMLTFSDCVELVVWRMGGSAYIC